jgi:hypothetical protein
MRISALFCVLLFVAGGCSSTVLEPVVGRIRSPELGLATAEVQTEPAPGGGVRLSTDIGQGRRAIGLTSIDTDRLISVLESTIEDWDDKSDSAPFRETLMGAAVATSRSNPFLVELVKTPEMKEPVFMLMVGYTDAVAALVLDKKNAAMWAKKWRRAAGHGF